MVVVAGGACSHRQNPERKDPLTDEVTGALQPTDRAFLAGDPAARLACWSDSQCPLGAKCLPDRHVCFAGDPAQNMTKVPGECALVPLYFAFDSDALVPEARRWVEYDARCLRSRGAGRVVLRGYADERGDPGYNVDLSRRRAETVRRALAGEGVEVEVAVRGEGATDPVLAGTSEHDYASDRRVELDAAKEK